MRVDPREGMIALGITTPVDVHVITGSVTEWAVKNAFTGYEPEARGQTFFTRNPLTKRLLSTAIVLNVKRALDEGDASIESLNRTVLHELVHVRQNDFEPIIGSPVYSSFEEYLNDPREVEARELADQLVNRGVRTVFQ